MFESLKLYTGEDVQVEELLATLQKFGYDRRRHVGATGDYSLVGETLVVFPVTFEYPVRIDIPDGRVKSIKSVDTQSFRTIDEHKGVIILPLNILRRKSLSKKPSGYDQQPIDSFVDIEPGDLVVHVDYGIGRYKGISHLRKDDRVADCLVLEYAEGDVLYVPYEDLDKVQRYIAFHKGAPKMNRLRGKRWQAAKINAAKGAARVAQDLLEIQAKRESSVGFRFAEDSDWQKEIEAAFPYKETPDQEKAAIEVKADMERPRPMDRLLCGDVGYGKTEVALRAVFKAVMSGKQVAVLVPTTILAEQHTATFTERFHGYPVKIEMLNRFRTDSEQAEVTRGLEAGKIDVVVGTHRLLSEDIKFKDLGLLVIDEEQRFGVKHKEKIKKLKTDLDILTLTATPIPRTLYLALMGGKDISMIETPPLERSPIETEIIDRDHGKIREAIEYELKRGGQVYFVHNRVETIDGVAKEVAGLVPDAKMMVGHGQMSPRMLESTMLKFMRGDVNVLVCTTIIGSGIDIPNANTMIIDHADKFGLADLYQLRGRIGRFDRRAYAYLIVRDRDILTSEVQARLSAIKKYKKLGSGFKIAMRDLEMRGAGNILGLEQSGFIDQVGFDLYCRLLRAEIDKAGAKK
ncbi:MAG: transcription-repair coupling factor [Candidatus Omnitrophica bacterium]|nr:transcription-repair coupling factor [Candidatus Omnitrophota bacterium]MDD5488399.1 transcription-repair coupling factor [Candidatus Omnitrophota bacterium]